MQRLFMAFTQNKRTYTFRKMVPFGIIMEIISKNPEVILISDEIGYGIVPFDKEERFYRELTGRIMCEVAKKANSVERIICGISLVNK